MGHGLRAGGHEVVNTTTRVYAHATGEWRRQALNALMQLLTPGDTEPDTYGA
jgi:hypothetical protein